jgi:hypothetical protein
MRQQVCRYRCWASPWCFNRMDVLRSPTHVAMEAKRAWSIPARAWRRHSIPSWRRATGRPTVHAAASPSRRWMAGPAISRPPGVASRGRRETDGLRTSTRQFLRVAQAATIRWVWVPRPSMPSRITSPTFRKTGFGLTPTPTPGGVPVAMTSPACRVMKWLT